MRKKLMRNEDGATLLLALGILALLTSMSGAILMMVSLEKDTTDLDLDKMKAHYVAVAGVESAINAVRTKPDQAPVIFRGEDTEFGEASYYAVTVTKDGDTFKIASTSSVISGKKTVRGEIEAIVRPVSGRVEVVDWKER